MEAALLAAESHFWRDFWEIVMASEPLELTISDSLQPPKHHCGTHGDHSAWVSFWQTGEPTVVYCTKCIMDFMNAQSIGRHELPS